jgi:hypothetical protein
LLQVGGAALAVVRDQAGQGIFLGPDGLHIPLAPGNERLAKCKLGPYYSRLPDGGNNLFAVGESARAVQLTNLRVYVREGEGEAQEQQGRLGLGAGAGTGWCGALSADVMTAALLLQSPGMEGVADGVQLAGISHLICHAGEQWELDGIVWKTKSGP